MAWCHNWYFPRRDRQKRTQTQKTLRSGCIRSF